MERPLVNMPLPKPATIINMEEGSYYSNWTKPIGTRHPEDWLALWDGEVHAWKNGKWHYAPNWRKKS